MNCQKYHSYYNAQKMSYCPDCGRRLERGEGSGALTGFSDAKRAEEPGSAEGLPQSLAVSPVEAEDLAREVERIVAKLRSIPKRSKPFAYCQLPYDRCVEDATIIGLAMIEALREAAYYEGPEPESEQGENTGDGKLSQESPEACATPSNGTASGRRNAGAVAPPPQMPDSTNDAPGG